MFRRGLTFPSFIPNLPNKHFQKSVLSGWRGRPYASNSNAAAAVSEAEAEPPNRNGRKLVGKRLPKAERQAMLESFVNKYRAMNAGAFPTVSYAHKQLGGSYYIVKNILQEIQYKAKMSPSYPAIEDLPAQEEICKTESLAQFEENSTSEMSSDSSAQISSVATYDVVLPGQEEAREFESLTQVEESSISEVSEDASAQNDSAATYDINLSGATNRHLEAKEDSQTSSSIEIMSEEVMTTGSDYDKSENSQTEEGLPDFDDLKCKTEQYEEIPQPDKTKDISGRQVDDAEPPRKSTIWGNMKSFANGIISIFRKQ